VKLMAWPSLAWQDAHAVWLAGPGTYHQHQRPGPIDEGFDLARWRMECNEELQLKRRAAKATELGRWRNLDPWPPRLAPLATSAPTPTRVQLHPEERARISEAIFSKQDPQMHTVCRGNMAAVLALREDCAAQSARERRRRYMEVGEEHRLRAVLWRHRREAADRFGVAGVGRPGAGGGTGANTELSLRAPRRAPGPPNVGPPQDKAEAQPGERSGAMLSVPQPPSSRRGQAPRRPWHSQSLRLQRSQQALWAEREAEQEAFNLYADAETSLLPAVEMLRCLFELGLSGSTRHERWAVDRICSGVYTALADADSQELQLVDAHKSQPPDLPGTPPGTARSGRSARSCAACSAALAEQSGGEEPGSLPSAPQVSPRRQQDRLRRDALQDFRFRARRPLYRSAAAGHGDGALVSDGEGAGRVGLPRSLIGFEDLSAEIVPAVRRQLSDVRREDHSAEFALALRRHAASAAAALNGEQFLTSAEQLGLDRSVGGAALAEMGFDSEPSQAGGQQQEASSIGGEAFHDLMMVLEERTARKRRRLEWEIRHRTGMPDLIFWRYRRELIRLDAAFGLHDEDGDGFISRTELRQLLKHLGFEPYRRGEALLVDDLLEEVDENRDGRLDLFKLLKIMEQVRVEQRRQRQPLLQEVFLAYSSDLATPAELRHIRQMLQDAELRGLWGRGSQSSRRPPEEEEEVAVRRTLEEFDTDMHDEIRFVEFEDLAQRVWEALGGCAAEGIAREARSLGLTMGNLAECQWAFDQLDVKGSGALSSVEVKHALQMLAGEPHPSRVPALYEQCGLDFDGRVRMPGFLRLMRCASACLLSSGFCLRNLSSEDLHRCLSHFPSARSCADELQGEELAALVGGCLGLDPAANLASQGVRSARQLLEFAAHKGQEACAALKAPAVT